MLFYLGGRGVYRANPPLFKLAGWVKIGRKQDKDWLAFFEVNDGSCFDNLQVLVERK